MKSKLWTALLSVVIAFGLWTYVVTNVSVKDSITLTNVPVVFHNEGALSSGGRNLMLTEGTSQTVTLTVTGTRSEVMKLHNNNVSVVVDLSRIYDAGRQSVQYTVNYPADVNSSDFEYKADKSRISLTVDERVEAMVGVVIEWSGKVAEGYVTDKESAVLDYRYITVNGPASVVEQIKQARIYVELDKLTESIDTDFPYVLCDSEGNPVEVPNVELVTTNVDQVHLNLPIQHQIELSLKVNVINGGGASEETTSIVMDISSIMVSGTDDVLAQIPNPLIIGTIDLGETKEDAKTTFPIILPEGANNLTGVEEVKVSISFPALAVKTFTITNIQTQNIPEGMDGIVVTKQVNVTVRGPQSVVQRMKNSDISVSVDFGNLEVGATETRNPTVIINPNFQGVGILEMGKVTISLQEPPPTETTEPAGQLEE